MKKIINHWLGRFLHWQKKGGGRKQAGGDKQAGLSALVSVTALEEHE